MHVACWIKQGLCVKSRPEEVIQDQSRSADAAGLSGQGSARRNRGPEHLRSLAERTAPERPTGGRHACLAADLPAQGRPRSRVSLIPCRRAGQAALARKDPVVTCPRWATRSHLRTTPTAPGHPGIGTRLHDALAGTGANPDAMTNLAHRGTGQSTGRGPEDQIRLRQSGHRPRRGPQVTTRDWLLNVHHNMQNMAHAYGWNESTMSLHGRLGLHLVPYNFRGESWYGAYSFADSTIHISGGSNSFAHEHSARD